jgi:hypothetical protein
MSFLSWLPSAASSILPSRHWSRTKSLHCTCRRFRIWIRTLLGFIRENTWFPSLKLKTSQSDGSAAERSASTDDVQLCSGSATQQTIWMLREFPPTFLGPCRRLVPGGWQLGMAPRRRWSRTDIASHHMDGWRMVHLVRSNKTSR